MIAQAEKVEFEPAALRAIARGAEGSMRDALSLLDQVLAFGGGRAIESEVRTLLGTLDRRHVEGILNALAAQDGAALMACVAQLDERAPDYDQALGELSAAIQRMALLQALPDLRGEDEEQDAALARARREVPARGPAAALPDRDHGPSRPRLSPRTRAAASRWRCCGCWRSGRSRVGCGAVRPAAGRKSGAGRERRPRRTRARASQPVTPRQRRRASLQRSRGSRGR